MKDNSSTFRLAQRIWYIVPKSWRTNFWAFRDEIVPYQKIIYKGKLIRWGRDRTEIYNEIFAYPPFGKTILDVGCYIGFYCFMAASNGAKHCLGIEIREQYAEIGKSLIKKVKAENIELIYGDVFEYEFCTKFDIVLCLNVLHHLQEIERAEFLIDKLYSITNKMLVFIIPLTKNPSNSYEYDYKMNNKYIHFSEIFFQKKFGANNVDIKPINPRIYGPDRALFKIQKNHAEHS